MDEKKKYINFVVVGLHGPFIIQGFHVGLWLIILCTCWQVSMNVMSDSFNSRQEKNLRKKVIYVGKVLENFHSMKHFGFVVLIFVKAQN
jgi:hypothetical protein